MQPAGDGDPGLEAFEAARRAAAADGIPQDGPLGQKAADLIRLRAGADVAGGPQRTQDVGERSTPACDLLAPLRKALSVLEDVQGNINPERGFADEMEAAVAEVVVELRAAIAKVSGDQAQGAEPSKA